ncbi:MAG: addiction module protein [Planctomycetes bacterium]|nr:addiction module protein [Planctomycetota bacterium]
MTIPKIDIERLSTAERLALIERIWDSLSHEEVGLTDTQLDELARRVDDIERRPEDVVSWLEAQRRIRERKR